MRSDGVNYESSLLVSSLGFSSESRLDAMSKFAFRRAAQCMKLSDREAAMKYAGHVYRIADDAISSMIDMRCIKDIRELNALYHVLDSGMESAKLAWDISDESWDKLLRQPLGRKNGRTSIN